MSDDRPVLVITGASSGIGAATGRAAVADGFAVVLGARSTERLEELARELGDERAVARRCDVTRFEDQEALVAAPSPARSTPPPSGRSRRWDRPCAPRWPTPTSR